jgi:hypothetical protein
MDNARTGNHRSRSKSQMSPERVMVDQEFFCGVLVDSLARGEAVSLRVKGRSMLPWLREGEKVRILPAAGRRLHRGDIALYRREKGSLVLHRVVSVRRAAESGPLVYECLGDALDGTPECVLAETVVGVVDAAAFRRWIFLSFNPLRRFINRFCLKWGIRLRHG